MQIPTRAYQAVYTPAVLLYSLLSLLLMQGPEPRLERPASSERPTPMNGGRLQAGGWFACSVGASAVALDVFFVDPEATAPVDWFGSTIPSQHIAIPICLHTVVAGAALRGRTEGRRDRLAGKRQDTTKMSNAGLGFTIAGPLLTGVAFGGGWLSRNLDPSDPSKLAGTISLGATAAGGVMTFATGLSLIATARNYESEFGRPAGVWAPRGIGSLTTGTLLGLGSLVVPVIATRTQVPVQFYPAQFRTMFGSTLLGAVGTHLLAHWDLEHRDGPQLRQHAHRVWIAGISLVSLAPALGTALTVMATMRAPNCTDSSGLSECEWRWRTGIATLGMLGLVSLEAGPALLSYGMVFRANHRHREVARSLSPWMLPGGFGMSWAGRF